MKNSNEMSVFAKTILDQKYAHELPDGSKETWDQVAHRVTLSVMKVTDCPKAISKEIEKIIADRKFIPGGRYLYASGRSFHQVQNCLLLKAEDSREGWADLMQKCTMALMTGAGIGVVYSDVRGEGKIIRKTGGVSTGPLALMQMVNEAGRGIMQGGSRRSAIWAGLHWNHPDCIKFIQMKNWATEVRNLKSKDYNFPATMDGTNISVILDDEFFKAYHSEKHRHHTLAHTIYWAVVRQMLKTAEPGFSIDVGVNKGENLRNACVSGDTEILTDEGYVRIDSVIGHPVNIWNGFEWSEVTPKITGYEQPMLKVVLSSGQELKITYNHKFHLSTGYNGETKEISAIDLKIGDKLIKHTYPIIREGQYFSQAYTQGFISGDGMDNYQHMAIYQPKFMCLSRLSGFFNQEHVNSKRSFVNLNLNFVPYFKNMVPITWDLDSRLNWFAGLLDSDGTELKEGGVQIASVDKAFLLNVQKMLTTMGANSKVTKGRDACSKLMPDGRGGKKEYECQELYRLLVGAVTVQNLKELGLNCSRLKLEKQPQRDASQFVKVVAIEGAGVEDIVYCFNEPKRHLGCFNGVVTGQCTELTSHDDSDICNIGSINMARITSLDEMKEVVTLATTFLLAGTLYSDVPYAKVDQMRTKNRRLGLGLMGLHEWLLLNGKKYGPDEDLAKYMEIYATSTNIAHELADQWEISRPVKTRAIAPTGSIGILGETTTGIEPIFCVAYKRRYLKGNVVHYQYVIDPTAQRLIDTGVNPESIEDAYVLAENVEKRVQFQTFIQKYVDHSISSTINLPAWGSELNNDSKVREFGDMLMRYLPDLRGVTCYPDGARGGQPLTPVKYSTAIKHTGQEFSEVVLESVDVCDITKGGSCG